MHLNCIQVDSFSLRCDVRDMHWSVCVGNYDWRFKLSCMIIFCRRFNCQAALLMCLPLEVSLNTDLLALTVYSENRCLWSVVSLSFTTVNSIENTVVVILCVIECLNFLSLGV